MTIFCKKIRENYIILLMKEFIISHKNTRGIGVFFVNMEVYSRSRNHSIRYEANSEYATVTLRIDIDQRHYS